MQFFMNLKMLTCVDKGTLKHMFTLKIIPDSEDAIQDLVKYMHLLQ